VTFRDIVSGKFENNVKHTKEFVKAGGAVCRRPKDARFRLTTRSGAV
jgi:hypothetical protein